MRITDIKNQRRNKNRFNIYVDGKFSFSLSEIELVNNKVEIGKEVVEAEIEKLKNNDEKSKALNKALEIIARRVHSEKEVRDKLRKKNFRGDLIDKSIENLKKMGYIDDEAFARAWIESRLLQKPRGRILIKRELLGKGVNPEVVESILELVYNKDRERVELKRLYKERKKIIGKTNKDKIIRYLISRGFLWEDIKDTIESENIN